MNNRIDNKELIISLIRDNLINLKLIWGLNTIGLRADDYTTFLSNTIFLLMGFKNHKESDFIFENIYLTNAEKVKHIDFSSSTEQLDILSQEIYAELVFCKREFRINTCDLNLPMEENTT